MQWLDAKMYASVRIGASVVDEVFVVEKDISDDLLRVRQLTEERERYKDLVENQQDVLYSLDLAGNFISVAYTAYGLWGFTPDELVGRNCWAMLRERDRPIISSLVNNMVVQRSPLRPFVVERLCKNNSYCKEEVRLHLKFDPPTNSIVSINGVSRKVLSHVSSFLSFFFLFLV